MHQGNREFLNDLGRRYPESFRDCRVLELGSLNINGSVRKHFAGCDFIGVDREDGPDVDLIGEAATTRFDPGSFDTLISMSMVEHDPGWRVSLSHNLPWLRRGGLFILGWGGEGNRRHDPEPWAPVPVAEMTAFLEAMPLRGLDVFAEGERYAADCPGAFDAIGWKT